MSDAAATDNRRGYFVVAAALYLLIVFTYRAFTTGQEYMHGLEWWMIAATDILVTAGLAASYGRGPLALYIPGVLAGLGLWAIRLHGHHSWMSGYWSYWVE